MNRAFPLLLGLMIALPFAAAQNETNDTHPSGRPTVCGPGVNCAGGTRPADNGTSGVTRADTCMGGPPGVDSCGGSAKSVPAAGLLLVGAAFGIALLALRRR